MREKQAAFFSGSPQRPSAFGLANSGPGDPTLLNEINRAEVTSGLIAWLDRATTRPRLCGFGAGSGVGPTSRSSINQTAHQK